MAVGRYETRRTAVVDDANAIGTAYLRAQTIAEPQRSESLALMRRYTDADLRLAHSIPNGPAARAAVAERLADPAAAVEPRGPGPRPGAERERHAALRRQPQHDDRHADRSRLEPEQPDTERGADPRDRRRRARARAARPLPGDRRPRPGHGDLRGRARDHAAARHVRPRPAGTRPDHRSVGAAGRACAPRWRCRRRSPARAVPEPLCSRLRGRALRPGPDPAVACGCGSFYGAVQTFSDGSQFASTMPRSDSTRLISSSVAAVAFGSMLGSSAA